MKRLPLLLLLSPLPYAAVQDAATPPVRVEVRGAAEQPGAALGASWTGNGARA